MATLIAAPVAASADSKPQSISVTAAVVSDADVLLLTEAEHESSARVEVNAKLCMIAERDLYTAGLQLALYEQKWNEAVTARHTKEANLYAQKYQQALADHRDATGREMLYRSRRDMAREDFAVASHALRKSVARVVRNQRG